MQNLSSFTFDKQEEYDKLIEKLEGYPADLLNHIHSDEEVSHVVNRATKTLQHTCKDKPPRELARIELAMHFDQKKVKSKRETVIVSNNVIYFRLIRFIITHNHIH